MNTNTHTRRARSHNATSKSILRIASHPTSAPTSVVWTGKSPDRAISSSKTLTTSFRPETRQKIYIGRLPLTTRLCAVEGCRSRQDSAPLFTTVWTCSEIIMVPLVHSFWVATPTTNSPLLPSSPFRYIHRQIKKCIYVHNPYSLD